MIDSDPGQQEKAAVVDYQVDVFPASLSAINQNFRHKGALQTGLIAIVQCAIVRNMRGKGENLQNEVVYTLCAARAN